MMKEVYAVGVLQLDTSPNTRKTLVRERLWYLFGNFEDAQKCVLENHSDIFERYYNYALIEKIFVTDYSDKTPASQYLETPTEWWFKAEYPSNDENNYYDAVVTACDKPPCLEGTVYFWVG